MKVPPDHYRGPHATSKWHSPLPAARIWVQSDFLLIHSIHSWPVIQYRCKLHSLPCRMKFALSVASIAWLYVMRSGLRVLGRQVSYQKSDAQICGCQLQLSFGMNYHQGVNLSLTSFCINKVIRFLWGRNHMTAAEHLAIEMAHSAPSSQSEEVGHGWPLHVRLVMRIPFEGP